MQKLSLFLLTIVILALPISGAFSEDEVKDPDVRKALEIQKALQETIKNPS